MGDPSPRPSIQYTMGLGMSSKTERFPAWRSSGGSPLFSLRSAPPKGRENPRRVDPFADEADSPLDLFLLPDPKPAHQALEFLHREERVFLNDQDRNPRLLRAGTDELVRGDAPGQPHAGGVGFQGGELDVGPVPPRDHGLPGGAPEDAQRAVHIPRPDAEPLDHRAQGLLP